jgi:hypothetical protein
MLMETLSEALGVKRPSTDKTMYAFLAKVHESRNSEIKLKYIIALSNKWYRAA